MVAKCSAIVVSYNHHDLLLNLLYASKVVKHDNDTQMHFRIIYKTFFLNSKLMYSGSRLL
jgi:hypothetical protein